MKPIKTTFFFTCIFLIIGLLYLFFPENGIRVAGIHLVFPNYKNAQEERFVPQYADISEIIAQNKVDEEDQFEQVISLSNIEDSVVKSDILIEQVTIIDTVKANHAQLKARVHKLEFPKSNENVLQPFFRTLHKLTDKKDKQVRIMHFGDSQIECDRITSYVRNKLQKQFGGSGPGLLMLAEPYYDQSSIKQENKGKWYRYTVFGNRDTNIMHYRYGIMGSFCSFTSVYDSVVKENVNASTLFKESFTAYKPTRHFNNCKIFAGYNQQPLVYEVYVGENLIDADFISPRMSTYTLTWELDKPVNTIEFRFSGKHSPEFYGVSLSSKYGVVMDNIPLRGSSGLIFTKMDKKVMQTIFKELKPSLLILQFGGNMVPYLNNKFSFYENKLYNQLKLLKELLPETPVIVIGVSDMSIKQGQYYVSYPNIEGIRDAMKRAAFRAGAAYWDLYEAMGGGNSMPSWVFAEPSLASPDFVHFNIRGARIVGEMLYNAIIDEYNTYK